MPASRFELTVQAVLAARSGRRVGRGRLVGRKLLVQEHRPLVVEDVGGSCGQLSGEVAPPAICRAHHAPAERALLVLTLSIGIPPDQLHIVGCKVVRVGEDAVVAEGDRGVKGVPPVGG